MCGQIGRQAPGSVRAGKSRDCGQQRAIVLNRFGHLIVEALVVLTLDSVVIESDSLADQYAGAGLAVVVTEQHAGYRDRESGCPGQPCEPHFGLHLRLSAVTYWPVEIARELDKQLGVQIRLSLVVFDRQNNFASRAAPGDLAELGDGRDCVIQCEQA
jgi:hypothetical protein